MRKANSDFKTGFVSRAGSFVENMDYFAFVELNHMACWVLADGTDSDQELKSAEMAVKSILDSFMERPAMKRGRVKQYLKEAHRRLTGESRRVRLKASLVLMVTDYTRVIWAVAGNSRLYHFRNGMLNFKSKDQSLAQQMADALEIAEDELDRHAERHNLLNYLGIQGSFKPFVSKKYKLNDGDVLLLCTPGLWEGVNSAEMLDALEGAKEPSELVDTLEEVLLSKQQKILNNYTIATIFANKAFKEDTKKRMQIVRRVAMVMIPILIIGAALFVFKARADAKRAEKKANMVEHEEHGDEYLLDEDYQKAQTEYTQARTISTELKDEPSKDKLSKKEKLAQLIVDGDNYVQTEDYDKALKRFQKAKKEAITQPDFDLNVLNEKIEQTESYITILELIKQGDLKFEGEDYAGAKDTYKKAKKMAIEVSFKEAKKELKSKIDETDIKMSTAEKETKQVEVDILEQKGDKSYAAMDFEEAIKYYTLAKETYQEIDMADKALLIERKIMKAEEMLNSVPASAPADANANFDAQTSNQANNNDQSGISETGTNESGDSKVSAHEVGGSDSITDEDELITTMIKYLSRMLNDNVTTLKGPGESQM